MQISDNLFYDPTVNLIGSKEEINNYSDISDVIGKLINGIKNIQGIESKINTPTDQLQVFIGGGCQLHCSYCFIDTNGNKPTKLDFDLELIDEILKVHPIKNVKFFGGDPLFNSNLVMDCVNRIKDIDTIYITSNGLGLTKSFLEDITSKCKTLRLNLSAEPERWGHRVARNGVHSIHALRHVISKIGWEFIKSKAKVVFNVTLPYSRELDYENCESVVSELLYSLDINEIDIEFSIEETFKFKSLSTPGYVNRILKYEEDHVTDTDFSYKNKLSGKSIGSMINTCYNVHKLNEFPFAYASCANIIAIRNGGLFTCGVMSDDFYKNDSLKVDIDKKSFVEPIKKQLLKTQNEVCYKCDYRNFCGSVCPNRNPGGHECDFFNRCFVIALKYISTHDKQALENLRHAQILFLDKIKKNAHFMRSQVDLDEWRDIISLSI